MLVKSLLWFCWQKRLNIRDNIVRKLGKNLGGCVLCQNSAKLVDYLHLKCSFFATISRSICHLIGVLYSHSIFEGLCLDLRKEEFPKSHQPMVFMLIGPACEKGTRV